MLGGLSAFFAAFAAFAGKPVFKRVWRCLCRGCRGAVPFGLLLFPAPVEAGTLPESFTRHDVVTHLHDNGITTVEDFIGSLPPLHRRHFALVFRSEGLARAHVSETRPRVVSWGADAEFVLSWGTDPESPFYESVEFLRPGRERWIAGVIDFSADAPEIREPAVCSTCHGHDNKPLWGQFPDFEGTDGNYDPEYFDAIDGILDSTDPRLTQLDLGSRERFVRFPGGDIANVSREAGNVLGWRHAEVLFRRIVAHEDYEQIARHMLCTEPDVFQAMLPLADRHLSVLADSGDLIQGASVFGNSHQSYSFGYGSLFGSFRFLVLHDLWHRHARVRESLRGYGDDVGRLYEQHFGARGRASLAARAETMHNAGPVGSGQFLENLARRLAPDACAALSEDGAEGLEGRPRGTGTVARIVLVDAVRDRELRELREGDRVNLNAYPATRYALRADVPRGAGVGKVHIAMSNSDSTVRYARTEYVAPYVLHGDDGAGNYFGSPLPAGDYYITAVPHVRTEGAHPDDRCVRRDSSCREGKSVTVRFSVVRHPFAGFTVFGADTRNAGAEAGMANATGPHPRIAPEDRLRRAVFAVPLQQPVEDGATLDRRALPDRADVRVDLVSPAPAGDVRLTLTGPESIAHSRVLTNAPYELFGDGSGITLPSGEYRLTATVHPDFGSRDAEVRYARRFSVADLSANARLATLLIGRVDESTSSWWEWPRPSAHTTVAAAHDRVIVRVKPAHARASVAIVDDGGRMPFGYKAVDLRRGANVVRIEVTAENGRRKTYSATITRD